MHILRIKKIIFTTVFKPKLITRNILLKDVKDLRRISILTTVTDIDYKLH